MPGKRLIKSSVRSVLLLASVLILLLAAYWPASTLFDSVSGDIGLYQEYGAGALASPPQLPREYPPLSAVIFAVPQLIFPEHYVVGFALMAALAAAFTAIVVDRLSRRGWLFVLYLGLGAWGTLFFRFDIFVVLLTVLGYALATRRKWVLAQMLLALGVGLKLYPLVLMPLVVCWQWRTERRLPVGASLGGIVSLIIVMGSTWLIAPDATSAMLRYHRERPLEFEALAASVAWLLGESELSVAYGSLNLLSPAAPILMSGLTWLNVGVLLALYGLFLQGRLRPAVAWALILLAMIATSKVFSTQYLLWVLPFVVLATAPKFASAHGAVSSEYLWLWALICLLTSLVYPVGISSFESTALLSLVTLRNGLWLLAGIELLYKVPRLPLWRRLLTGALNEAQYWLRHKLWLAPIILLLMLVDFLSLRVSAGRSYALDIGAAHDEQVFSFTGVYQRETDAYGATYRWSSGDSHLLLRSLIAIPRPSLTLVVGGLPAAASAPQPVELTLDAAGWLTQLISPARRHYHVLLPPTALLDGTLDLGLKSPASSSADDPRSLGIRLDQLSLGWYQATWLWSTWQTLLLKVGLVLAVIAMLRRIGLPWYGRLAVVAAQGLFLVWISLRYIFMAAAVQSAVLSSMTLLLAVLWTIPAREAKPTGSFATDPEPM